MTLIAITSSQTGWSIWVIGASSPRMPALPSRMSSLPQRSWIAAPSRSMASKSFMFTGTRVADAALGADLVVEVFERALVRARAMIGRRPRRGRAAAARPMPREAPVTTATRFERGLVMHREVRRSVGFGQQRRGGAASRSSGRSAAVG